MADLTWTPLTYLNGGKDARKRDYARVYLDIARETMLMPGSLCFFFFGRLVLRAAPATARFRINFPQNVTLLGPKS